MRRGHARAPAAALAAALALAGCGGSSSSPATHAAGGGGGQAAAVTIKGFAYHPATLTVRAGTKVRFSNADSSEHTATARGSAFDTGTLHQGDRRVVTLSRPGTYAYICSFHPFMHGTIVVR